MSSALVHKDKGGRSEEYGTVPLLDEAKTTAKAKKGSSAKSSSKSGAPDVVSHLASAIAQLQGNNAVSTHTGTIMYSFRIENKGSNSLAADPPAVKFSSDDLQTIFGNKVDFKRANYILKSTLVSWANPAPAELNFTLHDIPSKGPLVLEGSSKSGAATFVMPPSSKNLSENLVLTEMKLTEEKKQLLLNHADADLDSIKKGMRKLEFDEDAGENAEKVFLKVNSFVGILAKANEKILSETGTLDPLPGLQHIYAVDEKKMRALIDAYRNEVIDELPKTNFQEHSATLSRIGRTATAQAKGKKFGDFSDAVNITNMELEAAHNVTHLVWAKVRYELINLDSLE